MEALDQYTNIYVRGGALILSNCALLPAILATFRRRLWFEFTAFCALFTFSSIYHMTESGLVQIPYINYHVLQTMDFCFGIYYAIVLILHITDLFPSSYLTIPRMFFFICNVLPNATWRRFGFCIYDVELRWGYHWTCSYAFCCPQFCEMDILWLPKLPMETFIHWMPVIVSGCIRRCIFGTMELLVFPFTMASLYDDCRLLYNSVPGQGWEFVCTRIPIPNHVECERNDCLSYQLCILCTLCISL